MVSSVVVLPGGGSMNLCLQCGAPCGRKTYCSKQHYYNHKEAEYLERNKDLFTRRCKGCNAILTMHQGESLHSFARRTSCNRVCAAKARPKFNPQAGKETRISNLGIPLIVIVEGNLKCIHWWKNGEPSHGRMISTCKKCGRTIDELFTPIYEMDFTVNIHFVGMVTTSFFKTSEW